MPQVYLLENPRKRKGKKMSEATKRKLRAYHGRKRIHRRHARRRTRVEKSAVEHRPVFYGSRKKLGVRSHLKRLNPMSHRKHRVRRHHSFRHHYRRNPGLSLLSGGGNVFKPAMIGAAGILANNALAGQISGLLGTMTLPVIGSPKGLVKIVIPFLAATTIGKKNQMIRQASTYAIAAAIVDIVKPMLPTSLQGYTSQYLPPDQAMSEDAGLLPAPLMP
jgi:hypothetical protein